MNTFVFDTQRSHTGVTLVSDNVFRFGQCQFHCVISSDDYFSNLSDEIVLKIFNKLPKHDLLNISHVCKRWYRLSKDRTLWTNINFSNRAVYADVLVKFLNKGAKFVALGRANLLKSTVKYDLHEHLGINLNPKLAVEYLDLTNAVIDVDSLNVVLKNCRSLKKLSLESLVVNTDTFKWLACNPNLCVLNLCMCKGITIDCIHTLVNIKGKLNMAWTKLSNECVSLLCTDLPYGLVALNLSGCRSTLNDADVENLAEMHPNLVELDLSDARVINAESVGHIAKNLKKLEYLALSRCYSLPDSCYTMLSKLTKLIALDLFHLVSDKPDGLQQALLASIPNLKTINHYRFSSIARPIVGFYRNRLWGRRV